MPGPLRRPVTRVDSGATVGIMAAAAVVTVIVTRAYLLLTGYPQVGGEVFHIAHAVWGGLLLMIALVLVLAWADRWVVGAAAVVGGIGAGLFVDEVGKFITKDNDYFFPLAAPITYVVLALVAVAALRVGRRRPQRARDHLHAALELLGAAADDPLTEHQVATIHRHLQTAVSAASTGHERDLAASLQTVLDGAARHARPDDARWVGRVQVALRRAEARLLPADRARALARVGLAVLAVIGVVCGPGVLGYAVWQLFGPAPLGARNSLLGDRLGAVAWTAAAVAGVLGLAAGVLAWRAVRHLGRASERLPDALRWGAQCLLLLLGGVNVLSAYFNQFYVLLDASAQAGLLGLLARLHRRVQD